MCLAFSQSKSLINDSSLNIFSPPSILKDTMNSEIPSREGAETKASSYSSSQFGSNLVNVPAEKVLSGNKVIVA